LRPDTFRNYAEMIKLPKFRLDFTLHTYNTSLEAVKRTLGEFGEKLDIFEVQDSSQKGKNLPFYFDRKFIVLIKLKLHL